MSNDKNAELEQQYLAIENKGHFFLKGDRETKVSVAAARAALAEDDKLGFFPVGRDVKVRDTNGTSHRASRDALETIVELAERERKKVQEDSRDHEIDRTQRALRDGVTLTAAQARAVLEENPDKWYSSSNVSFRGGDGRQHEATREELQKLVEKSEHEETEKRRLQYEQQNSDFIVNYAGGVKYTQYADGRMDQETVAYDPSLEGAEETHSAGKDVNIRYAETAKTVAPTKVAGQTAGKLRDAHQKVASKPVKARARTAEADLSTQFELASTGGKKADVQVLGLADGGTDQAAAQKQLLIVLRELQALINDIKDQNALAAPGADNAIRTQTASRSHKIPQSGLVHPSQLGQRPT